MQYIVANLSGKIRRALLGGREHIVAPLSLIVPGVLDGSKGPLFYPPDEVAKNPSVWNHTPIVVDHPKANGQPVSACDPDVTQGVGVVLRAAANGKLSGEAWFDVENLRRVDQRILASLEAGRPIEVSTGLYTDDEPAPEGSVHNGKPYTHIARNYRPDHLAVLPDGVGACSIADGCGVLVNEVDKIGLADALLNLMIKPLKAAGFVGNATKTNQASHRDLREQLQGTIREHYGTEAYVADVFDKTVVYELAEKFYQVGYTADKKSGKVVLSNTGAAEVRRTTSYKPVVNLKTKKEDDMSKLTDDERQAMVEYIVANCTYCDEDDRTGIAALPDDKLTVWGNDLKANADMAKKTKTLEATVNDLKAEKEKAAKATANQDAKPVLTPEQEEDLAFARLVKQERRAEAIAKITANERNELTEEQLEAMSLATLQAVGNSLPSKPAMNYAGAAAPSGGPSRTKEEDFAPFGLPTEYIEAN